MARARNIKPSFFTNEVIVELPFFTRLLFIGLWTLADREGRLENRPRRIKLNLFPADSVDIESALQELHNGKLIRLYSVKNEGYIQIINFVKHQNPHYKEIASAIPAPEGHADSQCVSFGVPESQRQAIFGRDGRKCVQCQSEDRLTLDHIIPRSKGGGGEDNNLQTLCLSCNTSKNNRISAEVDSSSAQSRTLNPDSPSLNDESTILNDESGSDKPPAQEEKSPEDIYQEFFPSAPLNIHQQQLIAIRIRDGTAWRKALNFWTGNGYRARSVEKICDKYDEILKGRDGNTGKTTDPSKRGSGLSNAEVLEGMGLGGKT